MLCLQIPTKTIRCVIPVLLQNQVSFLVHILLAAIQHQKILSRQNRAEIVLLEEHGCLAVRALDFQSSGRGFDSQPGR